MVHSNPHITGYFISCLYTPNNQGGPFFIAHGYLTNCQILELVAFLRQHHSLRDLQVLGDDHDDDENEYENEHDDEDE